MSDLREQIAAALDKALPKSAADLGFYHREGATPLVDIEAYDLNLELLADAVIAELGLRPEHGERSNTTGIMWAAGNRHHVTRYVTEWERTNE